MALNLSSHAITKGKGGSSLSKVSPYVRLSNGVIALIVQEGAFYYEDGKRVKEADLPEWFEEELEKVDPDVRKVVLTVPKPPEQPKLAPKALPPKVVPKPVNRRKM